LKVLVIGAGVSGLFIALELLKRGVRDVIVVDAKYPGSGASLRNIGCFRSSFTSPEHVVLMRESISRWLDIRREWGVYIEQRGYIWVARREETLGAFRKLVEFHNSYGVPTRVIDVDELRAREPYMNTKVVVGALYDPTAGKMDVLEVFTQLYLRVKKAGGKIMPYTPVTSLKTSGGRVTSAVTPRGEISADVFIVAAAEGSKKVLKSLGVDLPIEAIPRHPIVTEPYEEVVRAGLVIDWDTPGSPHITQTLHGSIILARDVKDEPWAPLTSQRLDAFVKILKPLSELYPALKYVNISRYWMGYYDMTPDHHPIYGPVYPYENLFIAAGFSGHGLMMAPITGELVADWVLEGKPKIKLAENLTIDRFERGRLVKELAIVG
jgi:sarcosine oxidase subunit beta